MKTETEDNHRGTEAQRTEPAGPEVKFSCACGQEMVAPVEMMGQLVDCPNCGRPVMVARPIVLEPPKKSREEKEKERMVERRLWEHLPHEVLPVMPGKEFERVRENAQTAQSLGNILFALGLLSLVAALVMGLNDMGALTPVEIAGAFLSAGVFVSLWAQLMHVRAGIEEGNYLQQQMLKSKVDRD